MNENISENNSELIQGTEILDTLSDTEIDMEVSEMVVESSDSDLYLSQIAVDIRIILVLVLLSFCWSCMRAWRKSSIKHM